MAGISRTAFYYEKRQPDDSEVSEVLTDVSEKHPRWGFMKCFKRIRHMGHPWNHKRVHRVYTQLKLNLKRKRKQRLPVREPLPLQAPERANQCWSMDFMSDSLENHVRFRTLNVMDDYNRQALGIEVSVGMPTSKVIYYLDCIAELHGYPERIRVDNGTEFTSHQFVNWAKQHGIYIDYIEPGCPYQNGFIERFNRTYRNEVLGCYLFKTLKQVKQLTEEWLTVYNTQRPHDALKGLTPLMYKQMHSVSTF